MEEIILDSLEEVSGGKAGTKVIGTVEIVNCKHGIYIRTAPESEASKIEFRYNGEQMPYYGFSGKWCKVKSSKGTIGWVKKSVVMVVS